MQDKQIDKLLQRIAQGDNEAFELLYEQTKRGVFAFIYLYLKQYQDAEDVLQTVYLKIKQKVSQYTFGTNAKAWILQIAKNQSLNALKRRKTCDELTDDIPSPSNFTDMPITDLINKTLDEEERQIVILHVLWGYKHREIAELLSCPTGTVTSKYKRAIAKLKITLKEVAI